MKRQDYIRKRPAFAFLLQPPRMFETPPPVELPKYEVPGATQVFDLMDALPGPRIKTPFWDLLTSLAGPAIRRYGYNRAIQNQMNELVPQIAHRIGTGRVGYLLRVNAYSDETGNLFSPAGEVISAYGLGIEPLDALAETYRVGVIRNPRPVGLRDESRYCWLIREGPRLTCTDIPPELARELEGQAQREAERRDVLGGFLRTSEGSIERTRVAEYWSEVVQARIIDLERTGSAYHIQNLQRRMDAEQDRFNAAYSEYQKASRELADHTREQELLGKIGTVLELISVGVEAHERASGQTRSSKPQVGQENIKAWSLSRSRTLGLKVEQLTLEVNGSADALDRLQSTIRAQFERQGIPVPHEPRIPRINRELP